MGLFSYTISYAGLSNEEKDKKAIQDTFNWLGPQVSKVLLQILENPTTSWKDICVAMMFSGVEGYPVHAFGRKYALKEFRAWMHNPPNGEKPVYTDPQGFPIPIEVVK